MSTGLVLGKFAPLHRGHQLLIETAIRENSNVIVLIYNAKEVTNVPLPVRTRWIKTLYPQVQVIEAWDGPMTVGDTPEIKKMHEEYIRRILNEIRIDAFYSSEFYGEHVSQSLGAIDRRIDEAREAIPISGTAIRKNPFACRQYLDRIVYRDLITKVVFLGAPSTGKTTLAEAMAKNRETVWMPEYGREYWDENQVDRKLTPDQLVEIAIGHREREEQIFQLTNQVVFIDTDATTTASFARYYHGSVLHELELLASETRSRYDLFFLCGTDIPFDDTWDRSGEASRALLQDQIEADLIERRIPFIPVTGNLNQRIETVSKVIQNFDRYKSLAEQMLRR